LLCELLAVQSPALIRVQVLEIIGPVCSGSSRFIIAAWRWKKGQEEEERECRSDDRSRSEGKQEGARWSGRRAWGER
jgi:hypothetical protein